jgi:DNA-binding transcriptional MerR regulator/DNA gyrase inhibitor GyrI
MQAQQNDTSMERITISELSQRFDVSTRTLRYYEEIGLLASVRTDEYAYRTYDDAAIVRLQQIIVLRQLRIPLKQIELLLRRPDVASAVRLFTRTLAEVEKEIAALTTLRSALRALISTLQRESLPGAGAHLAKTVAMDQILALLVASGEKTAGKSLSVPPTTEEKKPMNALQEASAAISKLGDVRIITLPPATVAAVCVVGGEPELATEDAVRHFVQKTNLFAIKPDSRHYGFNHPNGEKSDGSDHGYERWMTIPEEMEVPAPFVKKHFAGGLYAAHMIPMGAFEEWNLLDDWVRSSDTYAYRPGDAACMGGCLEEHLNYVETYAMPPEAYESVVTQLDLLLPIVRK